MQFKPPLQTGHCKLSYNLVVLCLLYTKLLKPAKQVTMANNQRLYRKIFNEISAMISSGELAPGSRLPTERELAEKYSVSRATIREAIIALEATNRVSVKTGSGVYVLENPIQGSYYDNEVSPFEVLEARVLLEGESAALAAKMISDDELILLQAAFEKIEQEDQDDNNASSEADREFHTVIANATHNRVLAQQIYMLWDMQENLEHIKAAHQAVCSKEGPKRIREHKAILVAIAQRDATAARTAMRNHFSNVLESMHSAIEEEALKAARLKGSKMRERFSLGLFANAD